MGIYMPIVIMLGFPSFDMHVTKTTLDGGLACMALLGEILIFLSGKVHSSSIPSFR